MDLFKVNHLALVTQTEGGYKVLSPDSWSVKLSLLGLTGDFEQALDGACAFLSLYFSIFCLYFIFRASET